MNFRNHIKRRLGVFQKNDIQIKKADMYSKQNEKAFVATDINGKRVSHNTRHGTEKRENRISKPYRRSDPQFNMQYCVLTYRVFPFAFPFSSHKRN